MFINGVKKTTALTDDAFSNVRRHSPWWKSFDYDRHHSITGVRVESPGCPLVASRFGDRELQAMIAAV